MSRIRQQIFVQDPDGTQREVTTQNPLPVSDSIVCSNDIWVGQSVMNNFSGVVTDLFDDLHSVITDDTSNNPKEILVHFGSTIITSLVSIGAFFNNGGQFSNTEIQVSRSDGVFITVVDESTDSTVKQTEDYSLPVTIGFNAMKLRFHTANTITISNLVIPKIRATVSRIQALSELTNEVEDILSFRGALNVTDPLVHKLGVNEYFTREVGNNTTLSVATSIGDTSIQVVSVAGFAIGDQLKITENGTAEVGLLTITNIAALVVTLDRPLANAFPIGTNVKEVENNMTSQAGTLASPQSYRVAPPAGQIWQLTRVLVSMTDGTSSMDDDKFGSLTALTNGAVGRAETIGGRTVNITNWKANRDLVNDMYDINYPTRTPAGTYSLRGRWTFTNAQFIVELDGDESHFIEVLIQDDLTAMDSFRIKAQGRVFGG